NSGRRVAGAGRGVAAAAVLQRLRVEVELDHFERQLLVDQLGLHIASYRKSSCTSSSISVAAFWPVASRVGPFHDAGRALANVHSDTVWLWPSRNVIVAVPPSGASTIQGNQLITFPGSLAVIARVSTRCG